MKEGKLKLEDFKVQSFVTTDAGEVSGGMCLFSESFCDNTSIAPSCYLPSEGCPPSTNYTVCGTCYAGCTGNC